MHPSVGSMGESKQVLDKLHELARREQRALKLANSATCCSCWSIWRVSSGRPRAGAAHNAKFGRCSMRPTAWSNEASVCTRIGGAYWQETIESPAAARKPFGCKHLEQRIVTSAVVAKWAACIRRLQWRAMSASASPSPASSRMYTCATGRAPRGNRRNAGRRCGNRVNRVDARPSRLKTPFAQYRAGRDH